MGGGEEGEPCKLSGCPSLDLALSSGSSVHSPVILHPAPSPGSLGPHPHPSIPAGLEFMGLTHRCMSFRRYGAQT